MRLGDNLPSEHWMPLRRNTDAWPCRTREATVPSAYLWRKRGLAHSNWVARVNLQRLQLPRTIQKGPGRDDRARSVYRSREPRWTRANRSLVLALRSALAGLLVLVMLNFRPNRRACYGANRATYDRSGCGTHGSALRLAVVLRRGPRACCLRMERSSCCKRKYDRCERHQRRPTCRGNALVHDDSLERSGGFFPSVWVLTLPASCKSPAAARA